MIDVSILGATGMVGQKFVVLLQNHPQFRITELMASERSAGKAYHQACAWKQITPIPENIANITIKSLQDIPKNTLLFSGLDSSVAYEAERLYATHGHIVISNAKNHRMEPHVPLVIPEVNHQHIHAIKAQPYKGAIVTNPNCSTIGLTLVLAPLHRAFTLTKIMAHTMQAISGAGYPGIASLDMMGNVVPYIIGEEEKLETETNKILGIYNKDTGFTHAPITISAHCNRVPVIDGHTESISVSFRNTPTTDDIIQAWTTFRGYPQEQQTFMAPEHPILYLDTNDRPQPLLDITHEKGMAACVGRLRKCNILDYKFTLVSHNTIRGAAGAAILNAEILLSMGLYELYTK